MTPTDEQRSILDVAPQPGLRVLVIAAGAGTGKTATLKMLEQIMPGRGQYTAFNTSLVTESKSKFVRAKCNTTHSLAFGAVGVKYKHRLGSSRVRSWQIASMLGIEDQTVVLEGQGEPDADGKPTDVLKTVSAKALASRVTMAIKKFCQSADFDIEAKHFKYIDGVDVIKDGKRSYDNNNRLRDYMLPFAHRMWEDLCDPEGQFPFSHDCYVKIWQLGANLPGGSVPRIDADYILLDEAQDTAPVFLDVLKQQTQAMLIFVGDSNQAIYEWRGAVDAMRAFPNAERRLLSQSFRFGQCVADVANSILRELEEPTDLIMRGLPTIPSRVASVERPRCYLYRTNAGALGRVMAADKEGLKPFLVGGTEEVCKFLRGAIDLQKGRPTTHPELSCFSSWKEVQEYVKDDEGADLKLMADLIDKFGAENILRVLEHMPEEKDADLVVSTAHRSKGREWDTVALGSDFKPAHQLDDAERRLLYVAATRAKVVLDISVCTPFHQYRDRKTGEVIPGIQIRYTIKMPSEEEQAAYLNRGKPAAESHRMPPESPAGQVGRSPTRGAGNAAQGIPGPANGIPAPRPGNGQELPPFTWKSLDGKWCIRGPRGYHNQTVTVTRRDGSSSVETLRKVVKEEGDVVFYATR